MSEIKGYLLTNEEEKMCLELIKESRAKKAHEAEVKWYKKKIDELLTEMITDIGLDDTRQVIRETYLKVKAIRMTVSGKILFGMEEVNKNE